VATPFLSEIKIFSFNFAPRGWAFCNGQLLAINQNQALFSLLGTTYGGNGTTNFALPNLQGRVPLHVGSGFSLGQVGGAETHTLLRAEMASHTHVLEGSSASASTTSPVSNVLATAAGAAPYGPSGGGNVGLNPGALRTVGGGQPHENRQPYLTLNVCIALQGIFPSRN
jgi:microcystin-dependent protein